MKIVPKLLKSEIAPIFLIVFSFFCSIYFYLHFPAKVPTHWDYNGHIDGWSSAAFAAFFFPALNLGMYLLLTFLPMVDPKKERIEEFKNIYNKFKSVIILFMTVVYLIVSFNGMGYAVAVGIYVPVMVGLLFIIMGNYLEKTKMNWTMGVRNAWTMSSENVWNKTNRLSGKIFMISGVLIAMEAIMPKMIIIPTFIFALALIIIVPTVYSYLLYRKEKQDAKTNMQP